MHRSATALVVGIGMLTAAPGASGAAYVKHQLIVKYAPGAAQSARALVAEAAGQTAQVGRVAGIGARVIRVRGDAAAAAAVLNRSSAVLYAEPDYVMKATAVPNDALFGQLYGINNPNDADLDGP